jgi:hypothetical protein
MTDARPITSNVDRRLLFRADAVFRTLDGSLDAQQRAWVEEIPLASTVEVFDADPAGSPVRAVKPEIRERLADLSAQGGEPWVDRHMRMVLALLLVRTLTRALPYRLPPSVDAELARERLRLLDRLESADGTPFVMGRRLFRTRGIFQGTTLPLDILSGRLSSSVPRHLLERGGLGHLRESPWIHAHLDLRPGHSEYSEEARERSQVLMADFLRVNPAYQGTMSVSWAADPKAAELSPHHAAQVQKLRDTGAVVIRLEVGGEATVKHATGTSRTRRAAYERGEYSPTDFMTLWPRDGVIAASEKLRRGPSGPGSVQS